jgi:predicted nucleic acid-binding Zn ribbon protein
MISSSPRSPRRGRSKAPRALGPALRAAVVRGGPATLLAAVQTAWPKAAGEEVARQAEPVSERDGVVTVACRTAAWAHELHFLQAELLERLEAALAEGREAAFGTSRLLATPALRGLRFTADAARGEPPRSAR